MRQLRRALAAELHGANIPGAEHLVVDGEAVVTEAFADVFGLNAAKRAGERLWGGDPRQGELSLRGWATTWWFAATAGFLERTYAHTRHPPARLRTDVAARLLNWPALHVPRGDG